MTDRQVHEAPAASVDDARLTRRLSVGTASASATGLGGGVSICDVPHSLVRHQIFNFLVPIESLPIMRDGVCIASFKKQLSPLAQVCHEWRLIAQLRLSEATKIVSMTLTVETDKPVDPTQLLRLAAEEGAKALVLKFVTIRGAERENWKTSQEFEDPQWWESLFHSFPRVIRLDLSQVPLKLTALALSAASRLCPRVQALDLHCGPALIDGVNMELFPSMTTALCAALKRWHATNGGLAALKIPYWAGHKESQYAQFFRAVAAYCPHIEYLVCYTRNQRTKHDLLGRPYKWSNLPVDVWAEFCRRSPRLREISLDAVPFANEFITRFLSTPKAQFDTLEIKTEFYEWWHDVTDLTPLYRIVEANPQLKSFFFGLCGTPLGVEMLPAKIVNELVCLVATHCPKLEQCAISTHVVRGGRRYDLDVETVETLARLESAHYLDLAYVNVGDQTFVEVVRTTTLPSRTYRTRTVELGFECHIHDAVVELLTFMDAEPVDSKV